MGSPAPSVSSLREENAVSSIEEPSAVLKRAAVYPNINKGKQTFSKSARKRKSLGQLGSIEYLQHHYTKFGLGAEESSSKVQGLTRAIGPATNQSPPAKTPHSLPPVSIAPVPRLNLPRELPPTPIRPGGNQIPARVSHARSSSSVPELLRPEVVKELSTLDKFWGTRPPSSLKTGEGDSSHADILVLLKLTISTIRLVGKYAVALPEDALPSQASLATSGPLSPPSSDTLAPPRLVVKKTSFGNLRGPQSIPFSTPSRPAPANRAVSSPAFPSSIRKSSLNTHPLDNINTSTLAGVDPLAEVRKAALDLLATLRLIEEKYRLPSLSLEAGNLPPSAVESPTGEPSRSATPLSGLFSGDDAAAHQSSPPTSHYGNSSDEYDSDEDSGFHLEDQPEKKVPWEERLGATGFQYERDVDIISQLADERNVVGKYLEVVERCLFGFRNEDLTRSWEDEGRYIADIGVLPSSESLEADVFLAKPRMKASGMWLEKDAPFADRVHSLLTAYLPVDLIKLLPSTVTDESLLFCLSEGSLLCTLYNSVVKKSRRPWGYIPESDIHYETALALEEMATSNTSGSVTGFFSTQSENPRTEKRDWTFRRADNLKMFGGALASKRYLVPITFTSSSTKQTIVHSNKASYDPMIVAKRGDGYQEMLANLLTAWFNKILDEEEMAEDEKPRAYNH